MTRLTFHLVPAEVWMASDPTRPYEASSLADEGFIHCTDGEVELLRTAYRHYRGDSRPFLALSVDLDRIAVPWTIEDAGQVYPHVFGPIERDAIVGVASLRRGRDGRFVALEPGAIPE